VYGDIPLKTFMKLFQQYRMRPMSFYTHYDDSVHILHDIIGPAGLVTGHDVITHTHVQPFTYSTEDEIKQWAAIEEYEQIADLFGVSHIEKAWDLIDHFGELPDNNCALIKAYRQFIATPSSETHERVVRIARSHTQHIVDKNVIEEILTIKNRFNNEKPIPLDQFVFLLTLINKNFFAKNKLFIEDYFLPRHFMQFQIKWDFYSQESVRVCLAAIEVMFWNSTPLATFKQFFKELRMQLPLENDSQTLLADSLEFIKSQTGDDGLHAYSLPQKKRFFVEFIKEVNALSPSFAKIDLSASRRNSLSVFS